MSNELGIYDMSGNVMEWCSDWWGSYSSSRVTDPEGPETGEYKVTRGGSFNLGQLSYAQVTSRTNCNPMGPVRTVGFRVVLACSSKKVL